MKKAGITIALLLVTVLAFAQHGKGDPKERLEKMNEHMKTELELTDQQYEEVQKINADLVEGMVALRESKDREAMHELRESYHDQLLEVLTKEQMEKAKEMFEKRKKHRHKGEKQH